VLLVRIPEAYCSNLGPKIAKMADGSRRYILVPTGPCWVSIVQQVIHSSFGNQRHGCSAEQKNRTVWHLSRRHMLALLCFSRAAGAESITAIKEHGLMTFQITLLKSKHEPDGRVVPVG
jgi:hypothetical protein